MNACSHKGICLWGLKPVRGAYEMYTDARSLKKMKAVLKKTGTKGRDYRPVWTSFFFTQISEKKGVFLLEFSFVPH